MEQAKVRTLVDLLRWRAESQGERTAYVFLPDGETEGEQATFAQLDAKARRIAVGLRRLGLSGERAVLLYPPGPTYVAAFFGCLYAGVVAVPAYPPRNNRGLPRIKAIIEDSGAAIAMTSSGVVARMRKMFDSLPELAVTELFVSDELEEGLEEEWVPPEIDENSLAFLQYTSGSTGTPKGVMLSHANLLHNSSLIQEAFGTTSEDLGVIWLPPYHDMGLIGGLLHVVYTGAKCVLMPPAAFLQRPMRWLEAISKYRGTVSGGPNFAYELVAKKATEEEIEKLDLSSWKVAFNGAEPVRAETMELFSETFKPAGFNPRAHYPVYGLAEATLIVTGGLQGDGPKVVAFDKRGLEQRRAVEAADEKSGRELVACGAALGGQRLAIVNPETGRECGPGEIGEVWVKGPSVAQGYWERPEETERTFGGRIAETGEGPFLRTGDLGFVHEGQLFIAGRIKDLIIIRGVNYYPQDLELTSERSHPSLRVGSAAAFAIEVEGEEQLVIAQELEFRQKPDVAEVTAAIREAIVDEHGILPYAVVLVKPGRIPKTSSGKIQRYACRQKYLDGTLEVVGEWRADQEQKSEVASEVVPEEKQAPAPEAAQVPTRSKAEIEAWLVEQLSKRLKVPIKQIDKREPFARYGLDSVQAIGLAGDLEAWLGRPLSPTLAYDYPNIDALAAYLAGEAAGAAAAAGEASLEDEPIAVVGLSCRFPGAPNADAFWKLLREGVDAIREVPRDRWDVDELYDPDPDAPGKMITRWGGFIDDVDKFDAPFFGISPREATEMDPQQRLLLEVAWEALESAGVNPEQLRGSRTGVFVGVSSNDYSVIQHGDLERVSAYTGTGNAFSIAANRLSYMLDLRGPSMAIDTACSSSLVTVHLAARSLRAHETDLAVVGGVNLVLSPELTVALSHARMMSPEGRCKTFDASADGYVRGEGVGVVVLKRLSDAVRDNDNILAVIRGSAVNQDGRSNGLTAPNGVAQQEVIRAALADARVNPEDVDYVETHG
ncbi:MAG: AMP-binding protein, partial [Calditrichaeota bacterium]|nr:AMP-binding protein [Calditrichota bacterium]